MHTCTKCGHHNDADAHFCRNCGTVLSWQDDAGPVGGAPDGQAEEGGLFVAVPPAKARTRTPRSRTVALAAALSASELAVESGGEVTCEVRIRNQGTVVDRVEVEVTGPSAPWASCEPAAVNIYPDKEATILLRFAPPQSSEPNAGPVRFEVRVASTEDPSAVVVGVGTVVVAPFLTVSGEVVPATAHARREARFTVGLTNRGNRPVRCEIRASDPDRQLYLAAEPSLLACGPGGRATAVVHARASRWLFTGTAAPRPFTVTLVEEGADGAPAPLFEGRATFQQRPLVPKPILIGIVAAIVAIGLAILLLLRGGEDVRVPALLGQSRNQAAATLVAAGLQVGGVDSQASDEEPGTVIAHDPAPGSGVPEGTPVNLVLAAPRQPAAVLVPPVENLAVADAEFVLEGQGLRLGRVVERESDRPEGTVLLQSPVAGSQVLEGTPVSVAIAIPAPPLLEEAVEAPDLIGEDLEAVIAQLEAERLQLGSVRDVFTDEFAPGVVVEQLPAAGTPVASGAAIDVVVARSP